MLLDVNACGDDVRSLDPAVMANLTANLRPAFRKYATSFAIISFIWTRFLPGSLSYTAARTVMYRPFWAMISTTSCSSVPISGRCN